MGDAVDDEVEKLWKPRNNLLFSCSDIHFWCCLVQFWDSSPEWFVCHDIGLGCYCWTFVRWFRARLAAKMSWFGSRYRNSDWRTTIQAGFLYFGFVFTVDLLNDFCNKQYLPTTWLSSWKPHNNIVKGEHKTEREDRFSKICLFCQDWNYTGIDVY